MSTLFESAAPRPLADRLRPQKLSDVVGQDHLLGAGCPITRMMDTGKLSSIILWGPPGTGKTSLARLLAQYADAEFVSISAVLSGIKEIRNVVAMAKQVATQGRKTILFVDEVHRFNKGQQDAFLPHVEDGTVILIGATTENPSFELNNALLSRARVYRLQSIDEKEMLTLLERALPRIGDSGIKAETEVLQAIASSAQGDARLALNLLEIAADSTQDGTIQLDQLGQILGESTRRFDKGGDVFYEQISALHKAVRGSSPDAALYWFARMLDGGCDALYIARRVVRMASEDVGNADPRGLQVALNSWDVQRRLGSPEGELAIAQAIVYLAVAAKSNAVYLALDQAKADVSKFGSLEVPMHLRNAPTEMMEKMGYGKQYQYAHDHQDAFVPGENYFPEDLSERQYYIPVDRGLELKIGEKLNYLRGQNKASKMKRYPSGES